MGSCCSSKRNNQTDEDFDGELFNKNDEGEELYRDDLTSDTLADGDNKKGGCCKGPDKLGLFSSGPFKDKDQFFDEYLEEHLDDAKDHIVEGTGMIDFDYFLKVYQTAMIWNRVRFADKKKVLTDVRRQALKNDQMERYRDINIQMGELDEACLQDVLEDILEKIGLTEKQFNECMNFYVDDPKNTDKI